MGNSIFPWLKMGTIASFARNQTATFTTDQTLSPQKCPYKTFMNKEREATLHINLPTCYVMKVSMIEVKF